MRPSELGGAENYGIIFFGEMPATLSHATSTIPLVSGYNLIGYPYPVGTTLLNTEVHSATRALDQVFFLSTNSLDYAVYTRQDVPGHEWEGADALSFMSTTAFYVHCASPTNYVSHIPYPWPGFASSGEAGAWTSSFPPALPVSVNWNTGSNSVLTATGTPAPSGWTAQLIWSPDDILSPLDPLHPYQPTGGEIVLRTVPLNEHGLAGRVVAGQQEFTDAFVGGFVYTRVFNAGHNGGNPFFPSRYGECEPTALTGPLAARDGDPINGDEILTHAPRLIRVDQSIPVPVSAPPALRLEVVGRQLQMSWTSHPYAFLLQESPALHIPDWRDLPSVVTCQGSNHVAVVPVPEGEGRSYRLNTISP